MLSGLFGGGAVNTMAQAIGRFAGVSESSAKSLLSMLGPMVLAAVSQHPRVGGLDASGLASFLGSQKDQIAAAIPSGLADQLSAAGLMERAQGSLRSSASAAGSRFADATERTASRAAQATSTTISSQWPYWLAGLLVLGGLAWYVMGRPGSETVGEPPRSTATQPATGTVGMATPDLTVDGKNLGNQVNSSVGALRSVLPGVTDAASAQAALPRIQEATARLNEVNMLVVKLTPEGRPRWPGSSRLRRQQSTRCATRHLRLRALEGLRSLPSTICVTVSTLSHEDETPRRCGVRCRNRAEASPLAQTLALILHHARIVWRPVVTIMPAVEISDRGRKLVGTGIIERCDCDEEKGIPTRFVLPASDGAYAARLAKAIVQVRAGPVWRRPLILRLGVGSRYRVKMIRVNEHEPRARLAADGAIASVGAFAEINVSFKADGAAMAAA